MVKYTPKPHPLTFRWAIGSLRDGKKLKHYQTKSQGWGRVMSVLSPKQALDDSTKATRNDAVTPRWHTCSHVGHRQIPPLPWRKDGDQNHAEPKGALENNYNLEVLDLQTMKKNMMFWRTFVRCSFWCPHFFFGAVNCQTVDFRDVDPIHPKVGSPVAVSVCWVWKKNALWKESSFSTR